MTDRDPLDGIPTECANCSFESHLFGVVCWPAVAIVVVYATVVVALIWMQAVWL